MAEQLVHDREARKSSGASQAQGKPIYGGHGAVLLDGNRGIAR
jgi:hypothetical protein